MSKLNLIIAFMFFVLSCSSQTDKDSLNKNLRLELGVSLLNFPGLNTRNNDSTSISASVYGGLKYFRIKKHHYRFGIYYQISGLRKPVPSGYYYKSYSIIPNIGAEFNLKKSKNFRIYYGIDFCPFYSYMEQTSPGISSNFNKFFTTGISGVSGFDFKLMKNVILGLEGSFGFAYSYHKLKSVSLVSQEIIKENHHLFMGFSNRPIVISIIMNL